MTETTVRRLAEDEWPTYRDMRLTALQESPEAFVNSYAEEQEYGEELWRARMLRAERFIATHAGEDVGILSLRPADVEFEEDAAEVFGLWVRADLRGKGVSVALFQEIAEKAMEAGYRHMVYWVGTDNARAIGFATGRGFRPSEHRRPMHETDTGEEEIALELSLA